MILILFERIQDSIHFIAHNVCSMAEKVTQLPIIMNIYKGIMLLRAIVHLQQDSNEIIFINDMKHVQIKCEFGVAKITN